MSIDLRIFLARLFVTTLSAAVLSVYIGSGGCLWPIFSRVCRAGIDSWQLIKRDPSSVSSEDDMTALIILEMVRTEPLFGGVSVSLDMKNDLLLCYAP